MPNCMKVIAYNRTQFSSDYAEEKYIDMLMHTLNLMSNK